MSNTVVFYGGNKLCFWRNGIHFTGVKCVLTITFSIKNPVRKALFNTKIEAPSSRVQSYEEETAWPGLHLPDACLWEWPCD